MASILILAAVFAAVRYFEFTFGGALILAYLGISLVWSLSSRIATSLALLFLVCVPVWLILKADALAETFAIYAYYFLVVAVVGEIGALGKENKQTSKDGPPVDNLPGRIRKKIV